MEVTRPGETAAPWAEIAYEAIAPVYDDFTAHHNYDKRQAIAERDAKREAERALKGVRE